MFEYKSIENFYIITDYSHTKYQTQKTPRRGVNS